MLINYTPRWPLMMHYTCAMLMFGMSTIYHLFNSHSKRMMSFWIKFDYAGICFMIAGSGTCPIYYSFACPELEDWRWFYLSILWGCCFITLVLMMIPYFDQDHFALLRSSLFVLTGFCGSFPILHIKHFLITHPDQIHHFHIDSWALGAFLYVVGAIFYGIQFPESCCEHRFDIFGSSH